MDADRRREASGTWARRADRPPCTTQRLRQLIRQVQSGDWTAARELYAQVEPMVLSAMAPFRAEREIYSDLRGEAYLALCRLAREFDESRGVNPFTYLARTLGPAVQTAVDRARRTARRELSPDEAGPYDSDGDPNGLIERLPHREAGAGRGTGPDANIDEAILVRLALRRAISRLTERERDVLALWNAGYHSGEMEPLLGIRAESCSQILHRTLTRLRAELKDEIG